MNKRKGMSLIVLVITILVMIILAGVVVVSLVDNNPIDKAIEAKNLTNLSSIRDELHLYTTNRFTLGMKGFDLYPLKKNPDNSYVTMDQVISEEEKNSLSEECKYILSRLSLAAAGEEVFDLDKIDFTKFYVLDKHLINSISAYENELFIFILDSEYFIVSIKGIKFNGKLNYKVLPFNKDIASKYFTIGNNTYKFYSDGTLKALGQLNDISGVTKEELEKYSGTKEIKIPSKIKNPKYTYFSYGTGYAIDENDELWAWGSNAYNKLGLGNSFFQIEAIKPLENIKYNGKKIKVRRVWASPSNTVVADTTGNLWICGMNADGVLGQGNTSYYDSYQRVEGIDANQIENCMLSANSQYSSIIVKMKNGQVYGWGESVGFGLGYNDWINITRPTRLPHLDNAKQIVFSGISLYVLRQNGDFEVAGYNLNGQLGTGDLFSRATLERIKTGVKDIGINTSIGIYIDNLGNAYKNQCHKSTSQGEPIYGSTWIKANNFNDPNAKITSNSKIISNKKLYSLSFSQQTNTVTSYQWNSKYDKVGDVQDSPGNDVFINNGKLYTDDWRIYNPSSRIQLELREVFDKAKYAQGFNSNLSVIDFENKVYTIPKKIDETLKKYKISKILSNTSSRFALTTDGVLYARGSGLTGGWGDMNNKDEFVKITKDNKTEFGKINNIFANLTGNAMVFITEDNKMYWMGATAYIALPDITGDFNTVGSGKVTKYPHQVQSTVLTPDFISNIKDIKASFINIGDISGKVTYILNNDGELYSMGTNANMTGTASAPRDFVKVNLPTKVRSIFTLQGYTLALLIDGTVYGWGFNTYGQFGTGYDVGIPYKNPQKLNLSGKVIEIGIGDGFAIFAQLDGKIYGSGRNEYGQLGNGNTDSTSTFIECINLEK